MILDMFSENLAQYGLMGLVLAWFMLENTKATKRLYEAIVEMKIEITKMNANISRLLRKGVRK